MKKAKKVILTAKGGPYHGEKLLLGAGTMVFRVKDHVGHYDSAGRWHAL